MRKRLQRVLGCVMLCVMLMTSVTVSAGAASFEDVPANHWAAPSIQRCVELKFFQGETANRFGVGHEMTRSAFAMVLCRFFGWETPAPTKATYTDVPVSAWYAGAVEAAVAHGALTRQTETFRPTDPITREELTVMLIRALGYNGLAGLAQEIPVPFQDIKTNIGYIAMAYDMGLMSGTSTNAFSPDKTATRELVAVILMRLYDKIKADSVEKVGIVSGTEGMCDLEGFEAVGIAAGRLINTGKPSINTTLDAAKVTEIQTVAKEAGAKTLLYVVGGPTALKGSASVTAGVLAEAVKNGGYDGLFLDVPELKKTQKINLVNLVRETNAVLGDKLLYVMAEAPTWQGRKYDGYDYHDLAALADKLVLRIQPYAITTGSVAEAPAEPLEEVYYALRELRGKADSKKLSLLLTTTGSGWVGKKQEKTFSGTQIEELLALSDTDAYYSERYGGAYLTAAMQSDKKMMVWYMDGRAAADHVQLIRCFGAKQLCLSDLQGCSEDLISGIS